ncbi:MAG: rbsC [Ilumatobacteraceae bacterium]|nr:rbsC [Ilumatobacteraceae bacterium]
MTVSLSPARGRIVGARGATGARVGRFVASNTLLIALVLLCLFFTTQSSRFLTTGNLTGITLQSAILLVIVVPMSLLLMSGDVDLSVGSVVGISAVVTGLAMTQWSVPPPIAVVLGVATGTVIGAVNGILIAFGRFSALIVTLGMLAGLRGLAEVIAPRPVYGFTPWFSTFGSGRSFGVPYLVMVAIVVVAIGAYVLGLRPAGKHIKAIGTNREAAFLSGVRVNAMSFWLFVGTGAAAGLGGVMIAARLNSAPATSAGVNLELDVLTAALLGGIAFTGGRGSIRGPVLGVLFLGVLQNGLTMMNVAPAWAVVAKGGALVGAAALDWMTRRTTSADT